MDLKLLCHIDFLRHEDIKKRSDRIVSILEADNYRLLMELDEVLFPKYCDWDEDNYELDELERILNIEAA